MFSANATRRQATDERAGARQTTLPTFDVNERQVRGYLA